MHESTARKRKFRSQRRQAGMKALEVWLPADTAALIEHVKQPHETFSQLVTRALRALQAQGAQGPAPMPSEPTRKPDTPPAGDA